MVSLNILKMSGLLDILKKVTMKELKEYINKYICKDLEVGKKYNYNGRDSIHYIISRNIRYGLGDLCEKYGIEKDSFYNLLNVNTWQLSIYAEYDGITIWQEIGKYKIQAQQRKNASISNSSFTLIDKPCFMYYDIEDENISIFDYIIMLLEEKKKQIIGNYESEIASLKKEVRNKEQSLKEYKNVNFEVLKGE